MSLTASGERKQGTIQDESKESEAKGKKQPDNEEIDTEFLEFDFKKYQPKRIDRPLGQARMETLPISEIDGIVKSNYLTIESSARQHAVHWLRGPQ